MILYLYIAWNGIRYRLSTSHDAQHLKASGTKQNTWNEAKKIFIYARGAVYLLG